VTGGNDSKQLCAVCVLTYQLTFFNLHLYIQPCPCIVVRVVVVVVVVVVVLSI